MHYSLVSVFIQLLWFVDKLLIFVVNSNILSLKQINMFSLNPYQQIRVLGAKIFILCLNYFI